MKNKLFLVAALLLCAATGANAQFYSVKANGLGWATGTVNAGFEVAIAKQWSVDVSAYYNPIMTDKFNTRFWLFQPSMRYWRFEHFVGHFYAVHPAFARYQIGNERRLYKGWLTGLGGSYGYSWILSNQWNFTLEAGIGVYFMRDRKRESEIDDWSPVCINQYRRWVIAPSKLEVAFSYLF